jgi:hypothetical protein
MERIMQQLPISNLAPPHDVVGAFIGAGKVEWAAAGTYSPFNCFAGSKGSRSKRPWLYQNVWASDVYIADADPSILAVYRVWLNDEQHGPTYELIQEYVDTFLAIYKTDLLFDAQLLKRLLPLVPLADASLLQNLKHLPMFHAFATAIFRGLKKALRGVELRPGLSAYWELLKNDIELADSDIRLAAASLAIRITTFGAVIRDNAKGQLNVRFCDDKLDVIGRWDYRFPPQPNATVHMFSDYRDCLAAAAQSPNPKTIMLDPPYWVPDGPGTFRRGNGAMTPAYRGHKPSAPETMTMATKSLEMALAMPEAKRIFICNYFSERLEQELFTVAGDEPVQTHIIGKLDGMNHSGAQTTEEQERIWIIDRRTNQQLEMAA